MRAKHVEPVSFPPKNGIEHTWARCQKSKSKSCCSHINEANNDWFAITIVGLSNASINQSSVIQLWFSTITVRSWTVDASFFFASVFFSFSSVIIKVWQQIHHHHPPCQNVNLFSFPTNHNAIIYLMCWQSLWLVHLVTWQRKRRIHRSLICTAMDF